MASTSRLLSFLFLGAIAAAIGACASPAVQECGATGIFCPAGTHCAAAEGICISDKNTCGDAHIDPGEICDDGNTKDGDGCSADCKSDETCGNGIVDTKAGEVCDDGNTKDGDGCSANCRSNETCGNGVVDKAKGEVCDDGNQIDGDGCSKDCKSDERCGNGIVDKAKGEVCDDGNTNNGDTCASDCKSGAGCGNGVIDLNAQGDPIEECDDGNKNNNDDCRNDCVINRCGDGVLDSDGTHVEQCDPTLPARTGGDRTINPTETAQCNIDCTLAKCGDGKVNHHFTPMGAAGPEQCDVVDSMGISLNNDNADCTAACQINVCGDGKVDTANTGHHEECDDGDRIDNNGCTNECKFSGCGDGILGPGEDCDDGTDSMGNNRNHAGARCNGSCKFNVCGDGDKLIGVEQCDDGSLINGVATPKDTANCDKDCTFPVCGDNYTNMMAMEACDDGVQNGTATSPNNCDLLCHINNCGNGILEVGEQCDDGMANNGPGKRCNAACKLNVCGDGDTLTNIEQCDAGSGGMQKDSSTCDMDCTAAVCGDGYQNAMAGEACDHGANNGKIGDTCSTTCHVVSCGNNFVEQGEQCDPGTPNTDTATCNKDCTLARCGDMVVNAAAGETCDHGANNGKSGDTCSATCHIVACGNGVLEQDEQCDPGMPNTDTAACNKDCTFARCGDMKINTAAGEMCDDGSNNGKVGDTCSATCQTVTCGNGIVEQGEQCDPGTPNTNTATCNKNCTVPKCGDMLINMAAGEQCDDGPNNGKVGDTCSATCQMVLCGNGIVEQGEQCDPGTPNTDTATCNKDCTIARCGDGKTNAAMIPPEVCDDGPTNGDACPYNMPGCMRCNSTCTGTIFPGGPFCGNGFTDVSAGEQCDPGGGPTHGDAMTCDSDCTNVVCGDGHINAAALEVCDDFNSEADACGTCVTNCTSQLTAAAATGTIKVDAKTTIKDGDNFTIDDGFGHVHVFEFDKGGQAHTGSVPIDLNTPMTTVGDLIAGAINGSGLDIVATFDGTATVNLLNNHVSRLGNQTITRNPNLNDATGMTASVAPTAFTGMSGGVAGDCAMGKGCGTGGDCSSGSCNTTTHKCN